MPDDLTDDDKAILVELLRETIERDRFPLSPRVKRLRGNPREVRRDRLSLGRAVSAAGAAGRARPSSSKSGEGRRR